MAKKYWKNNKEKRLEWQKLNASGVNYTIPIHNSNNSKTRGPRLIFEQDYLKEAKTFKEIQQAVINYVKDNPMFSIDIVSEWAKDIINKRFPNSEINER